MIPIAGIGGLSIAQSLIGGAIDFGSKVVKDLGFDRLFSDEVDKKQMVDRSLINEKLVGTTVVVEDGKGQLISGKVEEVKLDANGASVTVNGKKFDYQQIRKIMES